jgi:hypothetical protein
MKKAKFIDMCTRLSAYPKRPVCQNIFPNSPPTSPLNSSLDSVSDSFTEIRTPPRDADYSLIHSKGFLTESIHSPYINGSRLKPPHTHRKFHILKQPRSPETPHGTYANRYLDYSLLSNTSDELMDTDMLYTPTSEHSTDQYTDPNIYPETPPSVYRQVNSKYVLNHISSLTPGTPSLDNRTNDDVYFLSRKSLNTPSSPTYDMLPR